MATYTKPYQTPKQLVDKLIARKLKIHNRALAEEVLSKINYYRFKIYLAPFQNSSKNYNGSFNQAIELYRFDEDLRLLLTSILGRIEIKIRTYLDQIISDFTTDQFWHRKSSLFNAGSLNHLAAIDQEFERSDELFAEEYRNKYTNEPPFWIASESISFGVLRNIVKNLKITEFNYPDQQNKLKDFSNQFGAESISHLKNWLMRLRVLRNRCAHHTRVWNNTMDTPRGLTSIPLSAKEVRPNRIYSHLLLLKIMTENAGIHINIKDELLKLMDLYPTSKQFLSSMGFPDDWQYSSFWA